MASAFSTYTVGDVMRPGVIGCAPGTPLTEVARTMAEHRIHCVIVHGLSADGREGEGSVWGIVSDVDLMRAACEGNEETAAAVVAKYSRPTYPFRSKARFTCERSVDETSDCS